MPVVDASVVIDWVAPDVDPAGAAIRLLGMIARADVPLVAPTLLLVEVGEALALGVRLRRWSSAEADASYALLARLPVRLVDDPRDAHRAWELSHRCEGHALRGLTYVAVAERLGERLLTADRELRRHVRRLGLLAVP